MVRRVGSVCDQLLLKHTPICWVLSVSTEISSNAQITSVRKRWSRGPQNICFLAEASVMWKNECRIPSFGSNMRFGNISVKCMTWMVEAAVSVLLVQMVWVLVVVVLLFPAGDVVVGGWWWWWPYKYFYTQQSRPPSDESRHHGGQGGHLFTLLGPPVSLW